MQYADILSVDRQLPRIQPTGKERLGVGAKQRQLR